jgi:hypothetical protein
LKKENSGDNLDPSKSQVITAKVKEIVYEIAELAVNRLPVEEDEDEYFKQIEQRHNRGNKVPSNKESSTSKFANKFFEHMKIRIYLLNTQSYHDLTISYNDTFRDVKQKVLNYLVSTGRMKVKHETVDGECCILISLALEIRLLDDDDDEVMVNMEINAFDDKALVVKTKIDTFAIVEKINYDPEKDMGKGITSILGTSVVNNSEVSREIYGLENYVKDIFQNGKRKWFDDISGAR